jgi:hypothetical protein
MSLLSSDILAASIRASSGRFVNYDTLGSGLTLQGSLICHQGASHKSEIRSKSLSISTNNKPMTPALAQALHM